MVAMDGLILSDSLMRDTPDEAKKALIKEFKLKSLDVESHGGETIEDLLGVGGRGDAHMDEKSYDFDFGQDMFMSREISVDCTKLK